MAYGNATPKRLGTATNININSGANSGTIYTVPANSGAVIKRLNVGALYSTTQSAATVGIYVNGNLIKVLATTKQQGSNVWVLDDVDLNLALNAGDTVSLTCSNGSNMIIGGTNAYAYLSGVEFAV